MKIIKLVITKTGVEKYSCIFPLVFILLILVSVFFAGCIDIPNEQTDFNATITVIDDLGREVIIPADVKTVALTGAGSARYMVYLQAQDMIAGVDITDSITDPKTETRPYMLAYPEIADLTLLAPVRATINAENALKISPDVILFSTEGAEGAVIADEATAKTGIPVVCFEEYEPSDDFENFSYNMRLLGQVVGKEKRAEEVITFFGDMRDDLIARTPAISMDEKPVVYIGGVSNRGTHGMLSTKPEFVGFTLLSANQKVADVPATNLGTASANIAKEKILEWDPDMVFVDLGTLNAEGGGALVELKNDPSYQSMTAVINGDIYTVMPDTSAKSNHGTSFANAYYVGTILYPEQFSDINPTAKADEIYTFLIGEPVFAKLNANTGSLAYQKINLNTI